MHSGRYALGLKLRLNCVTVLDPDRVLRPGARAVLCDDWGQDTRGRQPGGEIVSNAMALHDFIF